MKDLACPFCRLFEIDRIMTCQPGQQDIPVITDPFAQFGTAGKCSRYNADAADDDVLPQPANYQRCLFKKLDPKH